MDEEISELFSKHFNRIKKDLSQITGVTPLMVMVVSASFRNLEDDVKNVLEKNNGLDKDSDNNNI